MYTDGSTVPNPGDGGWSAIRVENGQIVEKATGGEAGTTNNRMELQALIAGLQMLPADATTVIRSDSEVSVRTVNEWAPQWERKGWRRKGGPIKNLDLIKTLVAEHARRPGCEIRWTRGHAGNVWNETADRLANEARQAKAA